MKKLLFAAITLAGIAALHAGSPQSQDLPQVANCVRGIDVSRYQGSIDWPTVGTTGVSFVYIKATQGDSYVDPTYRTNLEGARAAGVLAGSYHYFTMRSSAHAQFEHIRHTVVKDEQQLVPMIDVEVKVDPDDAAALQATRDSVQVLLNLVEQHYGKKPVVYGTQRSYGVICSDKFLGYPAYIGLYNNHTVPPKIKGPASVHYYIWQYSEHGRLQGIPNEVDLCHLHPDASLDIIRL